MAKPVIIEITASDSEPEHPDQEDPASEDETSEAAASQRTGERFSRLCCQHLIMLNIDYLTRYGSPRLTRDPGN